MIRKSPISGSWYAGTKNGLINQIDDIYRNKKFGKGEMPKKSDDHRVVGVISPHAGFVYSGYTASHSYHYLFSNLPEVDLVIILGPNHTGMGSEIAFSKDTWETPLGLVEIDRDLLAYAEKYDFEKISPKFDELTHKREHSIEIQLPFVQHLYDSFTFFPICISSQLEYKAIAEFLYDVINQFNNKKIGIISSSDLSHEYDYKLLVDHDQKMIDLISAGESNYADNFRREKKMTMCGYGPVFALMELRKLMGSKNSLEFLSYSNSSMIIDNYEQNKYRVGYSSFGTVLE